VKRVSDHRREMKVSGKIHMVKRMVKRKRRRGRGGEGEEEEEEKEKRILHHLGH
jgi:hypothetical protein